MENQFSSIESALLAAGWANTVNNPFPEKVSQGADLYFTYANTLGNQLGICIFEKMNCSNFV